MKNPDAGADSPRSIGAFLQETRLSRNINLEEVSAATGISLAVLRALESEEREKLPAEVYIKAFYKKYGEYLGLDTEDIYPQYRQQQPGRNKGGRVDFNTVITLKDREENLFTEILRKVLLPIAILIAGALLYWIYKNYLASYTPFGFWREYHQSVCSLLPLHASDLFS